MAYKNIEYGFSFADIAIQACSDKNRNYLFLRQVESVIDRRSIQDRLSKYYETGKPKRVKMITINSDLLLQFHQQGLSINQGIAVDVRLVKSAVLFPMSS